MMDRSVVFSVHDMKIYPVTDPGDSATAPTYGTAVDVPGIISISLDESMTESVLRGDGKILDRRSVLDSMDLSFAYAKLDPAVLSVLDGGTVTTGADPVVTRYVRNAEDQVPAFGFACLVSEVDNPGGAAKVYGYNAKISGGGIFGATDNEHGEMSFDASADPAAIDPGPIFAIDLEDVKTALPADGTELIATYAALT
jgi:hypothetical protein